MMLARYTGAWQINNVLHISFSLLLKKTYVPIIIVPYRKMVLDQMPICRLFRNSVCRHLSSVYSASTAYSSLCKGLKHLLKILHFIKDYINMDFWPSRLFVWAGRKHFPISEKKSRKWTTFVVDNTYFLQNITEYASNWCNHSDELICQM